MKKSKILIASLLLVGSLASAKTLATVNGTAITQNDVDTALQLATKGAFNQLPQAQQEQFRTRMLDQLISRELIFSDAKKSGVLKSKEFKTELEKIKKELAIQVWQKKLVDSIKISTAELKKYYNQNKVEFQTKASVHARHILLKTEADAKDIIAKLKGLKGDKLKNKFIELARESSTGPTASRGGDLGYFSQGQMVPAFNDTAFSMKKGEVTKEPVKTQFGYHVIYVEDKKPESVRSFSEVKPFIEQRLKMENLKTKVSEKLEQLKVKAKIKK